jgi:Tfp pilus assembly protein PilN
MTVVNDAAVAQLSPTAVATVPVTPLGSPSMGSITFSGKSTDFDAVAAWLQTLARQQGYIEPSVQGVTRNETTDTVGKFFDVESSVWLSPEAASGRYLQIANGE